MVFEFRRPRTSKKIHVFEVMPGCLPSTPICSGKEFGALTVPLDIDDVDSPGVCKACLKRCSGISMEYLGTPIGGKI
jgi:hypothetical protein